MNEGAVVLLVLVCAYLTAFKVSPRFRDAVLWPRVPKRDGQPVFVDPSS